MKLSGEIITSRNNPLVKWAASLSDKKGQRAEKSFIVEGEKLTVEALKKGLPIIHIFIAESKRDRVMSLISDFIDNKSCENCTVTILSDVAFEKISTEKAPQGVISVIKYLDFFRNLNIINKEEFLLSDGERAILLYSLRDPGNLGAVIRSAVAFGVDHVILTDDCADIYNPKTIRAAMGTLFKVKVTTVTDISSFIESAKHSGRRVFAAELTDNAKSVKDLQLSKNDIFIIGNEGHGISAEVSGICTSSVYIPISEGVESLNASVAAAVLMWQQNNL